MTVVNPNAADGDRETRLTNNWYTATFGGLIWLVITIMNVSLLVLVGLGKA